MAQRRDQGPGANRQARAQELQGIGAVRGVDLVPCFWDGSLRKTIFSGLRSMILAGDENKRHGAVVCPPLEANLAPDRGSLSEVDLPGSLPGTL